MVVTTRSKKSSTYSVSELVSIVDRLTKQVKLWQDMQENTYHSAIDTLESRMSEVSSRMKTYSNILESTSSSSLDTKDIHVLECLSFRISRLERQIHQLDESFMRDASLTRKQFVTWRVGIPNWMINSKKILRTFKPIKMILLLSKRTKDGTIYLGNQRV